MSFIHTKRPSGRRAIRIEYTGITIRLLDEQENTEQTIHVTGGSVTTKECCLKDQHGINNTWTKEDYLDIEYALALHNFSLAKYDKRMPDGSFDLHTLNVRGL